MRFRQFYFEGLVPQAGTQKGSNPGGLHVDSKTGEHHYVKYYRNPEQGRVEALTGRLYGMMGIHTVDPHVRNVNGKEAIVSKWNPHLKQKSPRDWENVNAHQAHQLGRIFHAAVLTRNWDVVGLEHDNILQHEHTGDVHAIDHGGSFHYRAQGAPKPGGFTDDIGEHHSLLHQNDQTSHVFGHAFRRFPEAERKGLDSVRGLDMGAVHTAFKESGIKNWQDLHKNFLTRHQRLLDHYGDEK